MAKLKAGLGEIKETVIQERVVSATEQNEDDGLNQTDGGPRDLFDFVSTIPVEQHSEYILYVNRTAPEKSKGYIGKLSLPFDQDTIRTNFGGGIYRLMLKKGPEIRRAVTFDVVGEPKTDYVPAPVAPAASPNGFIRSDVQAIAEMILKNSPGVANADMMKTAFMNAMEIQKAAAASQQMNPLQMMEMFARISERSHAPTQSEMPDWLKQILVAAIPAVTGLFINMLTPKNPLTEVSTLIGAMNEIKGSLGPGSPAPKVDLWAELVRNGPGLMRSAAEMLGQLNQATAIREAAMAAQRPQGPRIIPPTPGAHTAPAVAVMPPPATATPAPVNPQVVDAQIQSGAPSPEWVMARVQAMINEGQSPCFCLDWIEEQGVSVKIPVQLVTAAIREVMIKNEPGGAAEAVHLIKIHLPLALPTMRSMSIESLKMQATADDEVVAALPHLDTFMAQFHMELHQPESVPLVN